MYYVMRPIHSTCVYRSDSHLCRSKIKSATRDEIKMRLINGAPREVGRLPILGHVEHTWAILAALSACNYSFWNDQCAKHSREMPVIVITAETCTTGSILATYSADQNKIGI